MKIQVKLQPSTQFSAPDLFGIIDMIAFESDVIPASFSPTSFQGTGVYNGSAASYIITGSGFAVQQVGADIYVVSGTIDTIQFTNSGETVTFQNVDIDMATFSPLIIADENRTNPTAVEDYLMARDWSITLGNQDDVATENTRVSLDNVLFNLTGNDLVRAGGGDDDLFAGRGNDRMLGGRGADTLEGGRGNDKLFGQSQGDILRGDKGRDLLDGGNGKDRMFGGSGDDTHIGGRGADFHNGGRGFDTFVFNDLDGNDKIAGFELDDREKIDLSGVSAISGFRDLMNNHITQIGTRSVIDGENGVTITLLETNLDDLTSGDFIF